MESNIVGRDIVLIDLRSPEQVDGRRFAEHRKRVAALRVDLNGLWLIECASGLYTGRASVLAPLHPKYKRHNVIREHVNAGAGCPTAPRAWQNQAHQLLNYHLRHIGAALAWDTRWVIALGDRVGSGTAHSHRAGAAILTAPKVHDLYQCRRTY
jgi:hypothetical protein